MFGRRKDDEDPFAALKEGGTYQSSPTALPDIGLGSGAESPAAASATASAPLTAPALPAAAPAAVVERTTESTAAEIRQAIPTVTPGRTRSPRPRRAGSPLRPFGIGTRIVWRLIVIAIVLSAVAVPLSKIGKSVHSIKIPSFNFGTGSTPSLTPPATHPARPVSYLTASGVRAGLAHVRRVAPGARLTLLRLDARTLSVTATTPDGDVKQIYFSPAATIVSPGSPNGQQPVPIGRLSSQAVARIVTQMRTRFHVPPNRIDYIVLSSPRGLTPHWIVFAKGPAHSDWWATLSGRDLKPVGA
jgi:hypothetical protein